ncbi:MAG: ABC transporter permease subunit [bacterium]|nr:ABC transporter permease subunit [bacterium]
MYSVEHKNYLKSKRKTKILVIITQLFIITFFIFIWQYLADKEIINTFILSSPKMVLNTIISLHQTSNLYHHIYITVYETTISFLLGTIIGILLATILWWNKFLSKVLDPYLTIINSLPKISLGPIIIIWAGATNSSIIIMALLISVIVTVMTVYSGFVNTDTLKIKLLQSFNASKFQIFRYVVFPSSYNCIVSSLKINISMSLIGLIEV